MIGRSERIVAYRWRELGAGLLEEGGLCNEVLVRVQDGKVWSAADGELDDGGS